MYSSLVFWWSECQIKEKETGGGGNEPKLS